MSIYLPDELHRRLQRLHDRINWSQVAQKAFESELRLNPIWSTEKMNQVIERLRASKIKEVDEVFATGVKAGRQWAEQTASFRHLQIVAQKVTLPVDPDDVPYDAIPRAIGAMHWEFFKSFTDQSPVDPFFQKGFLRGAQDVWREVRDHFTDSPRGEGLAPPVTPKSNPYSRLYNPDPATPLLSPKDFDPDGED